jgi:16S rRNA (cytidine1402-2'-O)-methyltransferase
MAGTLFLVATPLGGLGDISLRALELLRRVDGVICEDTRRTRKLLSAYGIRSRLLSLTSFDEAARAAGLLDRIAAGEDLAFCSDAGSVSISDPGRLLVCEALARGIPVDALPGPCAAVLALQLSGLPTERFYFAGFLPRKGSARQEAMAAMAGIDATLILYESPRRLAATLRELEQRLGDRSAAVARELTKVHQEVVRGPLSTLAQRYAGGTRGEVTLVVAGAGNAPPARATAPRLEGLDADILAAQGEGLGVRELSRRIAKVHGLPSRAVYRRALELRRASAEGDA